MSDLKLLPCPFCGVLPSSYASPNAVGGSGWLIVCRMHPDDIWMMAHSEAEAIAAWNTRTEPSRVQVLEEAFRLGATMMGESWVMGWTSSDLKREVDALAATLRTPSPVHAETVAGEKGDPRWPWFKAWQDSKLAGGVMDRYMFQAGFNAALAAYDREAGRG